MSIVESLFGGSRSDDWGTQGYWDRVNQAQAQSQNYLAALGAQNIPQPPARPRNIDPARRMTAAEVAAFNAVGLLTSHTRNRK